jgi:hypothetical protein
MQKKLTITLDERVYDGLHTVVGRRRSSRFSESLVRPNVLGKDLEVAYQQMAHEEAREAEALAWGEATVGDVVDETRSSLISRLRVVSQPENRTGQIASRKAVLHSSLGR